MISISKKFKNLILFVILKMNKKNKVEEYLKILVDRSTKRKLPLNTELVNVDKSSKKVIKKILKKNKKKK